jgi:preprotein translocase subunit SecA
VIYEERRSVLHGDDLHEQVRNMLDDVVSSYVQGATADGYAEEWDLEKLWTALKTLYPVGVSIEDLETASGGGRHGLSSEFLSEELTADVQAAYDRREESLGVKPDGELVARELERRVVLSVLDRKWREHLYEMDYLQEGIQLRSYGQRDPLVEYQREGFTMFATMMDAIKEESVGFLFNLDVQIAEPEEEAPADEVGVAAPGIVDETAPEIDDEDEADDVAATAKLGSAAAAITAAVATPGAKPAVRLPVVHEPVLVAPGLEAPKRPSRLSYSAPTIDGDSGGIERTSESTGSNGAVSSSAAGSVAGELPYAGTSRNAKCPCGSGKAYKRCHGDPRNVD